MNFSDAVSEFLRVLEAKYVYYRQVKPPSRCRLRPQFHTDSNTWPPDISFMIDLDRAELRVPP